MLKTSHMSLLEHALDGIDSTAAHGWNVRGSVTCNNIISVLPVWEALQIHVSITISSSTYVPGLLNCLADDALRLFTRVLTLCLHSSTQNTHRDFFGNTLPYHQRLNVR